MVCSASDPGPGCSRLVSAYMKAAASRKEKEDVTPSREKLSFTPTCFNPHYGSTKEGRNAQLSQTPISPVDACDKFSRLIDD